MSIKYLFNPTKLRSAENSRRIPLSENGIVLKGENGCTAILIHGLTGTPNEMRYVANLLNKKGYSVICPRLANHGEPLAILQQTTWQEFYESVRKVFTTVRQEKPNEKIFVAGLCMGALLGLLLADEFGSQVLGVSCLSVTLFYDGWGVPWYRILLPLFLRTPLKHFSYYKEDPPYGIKDEAIRERVHRYYTKATFDDLEQVGDHGYPYVPATVLYQNELLIKYVVKRLPFIEVPVQLIQAKEDDTTSVKNSEFVYNRIKSKTKELILLEDSYHIITVDRQRDKVAEKIDAFFSSVAAL